MNQASAGFLLLTSKLGNPHRNVLTVAQMRTLYQRARHMQKPVEDRDLTADDLIRLGYGQPFARRVVALLEEEEQLKHYLRKAARWGCVPVTRIDGAYPPALHKGLGPDAPGTLWAKGDLSILASPMVSLVGSRDLNRQNQDFAWELGRQAALQGFTLVSGNARGADRTAQNACLEAGGRVISIVADELAKQPEHERILYLSEEDYDEAFSAQRALSRNRCIHALGEKTFVAQSGNRMGGTWDGTVKNLRFGWSPVFVFRDGSEAAAALCQMGAQPVEMVELEQISSLQPRERNFLSE